METRRCCGLTPAPTAVALPAIVFAKMTVHLEIFAAAPADEVLMPWHAAEDAEELLAAGACSMMKVTSLSSLRCARPTFVCLFDIAGAQGSWGDDIGCHLAATHGVSIPQIRVLKRIMYSYPRTCARAFSVCCRPRGPYCPATVRVSARVVSQKVARGRTDGTCSDPADGTSTFSREDEEF